MNGLVKQSVVDVCDWSKHSWSVPLDPIPAPAGDMQVRGIQARGCAI
jgi:hypothetical protein